MKYFTEKWKVFITHLTTKYFEHKQPMAIWIAWKQSFDSHWVSILLT